MEIKLHCPFCKKEESHPFDNKNNGWVYNWRANSVSCFCTSQKYAPWYKHMDKPLDYWYNPKKTFKDWKK